MFAPSWNADAEARGALVYISGQCSAVLAHASQHDWLHHHARDSSSSLLDISQPLFGFISHESKVRMAFPLTDRLMI
jgi:hypothetical protein